MATRSLTAPEGVPGSAERPLLADRRIVVTGVLTNRSLAYHAAERMQQLGAEIVLTSFKRQRRITERAAQTLPDPPDVLELDVLEPSDFSALTDELRSRWGCVDGVLHSIAFAPPELFNEPFMEVPYESVDVAMRASTYSMHALVAALLPLMRESPGGASVVGLTAAQRARMHSYAWMAVVKSALAGLVRQLAVQCGRDGTRVNLLAAGPLRTNAGSAIPGLDDLAEDFRERAPLGWDDRNFSAIAEPTCFLLSEYSRLITGEVLNVDGGRHVVL